MCAEDVEGEALWCGEWGGGGEKGVEAVGEGEGGKSEGGKKEGVRGTGRRRGWVLIQGEGFCEREMTCWGRDNELTVSIIGTIAAGRAGWYDVLVVHGERVREEVIIKTEDS